MPLTMSVAACGGGAKLTLARLGLCMGILWMKSVHTRHRKGPWDRHRPTDLRLQELLAISRREQRGEEVDGQGAVFRGPRPELRRAAHEAPKVLIDFAVC